MLSVLSPAKSLDLETPLTTQTYTIAEHNNEAAALIEALCKKSPEEIADLMHISANLADLNHERYIDWEPPTEPGPQTRQAILAFDGDVYKGLNAPNAFSAADFERAQKSLRILSGLYGALRPLDLIMPYRLEMGTKLQTDGGKNLYEFWGSTITNAIHQAIEESPGEQVLVNLASNEYFKSIKKKQVPFPVIEPKFMDAKGEKDYKVISFFAKKARGAMTRWLIQSKIERAQDIRNFTEMGYTFDPARSTAAVPTFTRKVPV